MNRFIKLLAGIGVFTLSINFAQADVSLNSARVTSEDTEALAEFYKKSFGMFEVQRIPMGNGAAEIMLNFGATEAEALANRSAQVVLMPRAAGEEPDGVAHIIFTATDIHKTVTALKAAGGTMDREPFEFGDTGIFIGMGIDPAGNHFELLQFAESQ